MISKYGIFNIYEDGEDRVKKIQRFSDLMNKVQINEATELI